MFFHPLCFFCPKHVEMNRRKDIERRTAMVTDVLGISAPWKMILIETRGALQENGILKFVWILLIYCVNMCYTWLQVLLCGLSKLKFLHIRTQKRKRKEKKIILLKKNKNYLTLDSRCKLKSRMTESTQNHAEENNLLV